MNTNGPAEPLDGKDFLILDDVRDVYGAIDPMPSGILDDIRFALAVEHLETEVARAAEDLIPVVTRGEDEQRLHTFECAAMTIVVSVRHNDNGTARVDGWLEPPRAHPVELRTPEGSITTWSDERGRFALDSVAHGSGYLTVRPAGSRAVTTPTIAL
ncbi:hypothetical protein [Lentzea sp. NPDC051838]|uniref:hypothetical protein n=1 Tax=Lentzea sp. NPDC051838 TaxID=3154849 RepID=UPI00343FCF2B